MWLEEAQANYNLLIYGTEKTSKILKLPPNLWQCNDYTTAYCGGGFMLWLDKKFPGFVDKSNRMAQEKLISWNDLEKLAGGQSLESLWRKYKKINFATEISPFIEEQRRKYLESDRPDSYGPDRDLTENIDKEANTVNTEDIEDTESAVNIVNIATMIIFAYIVYKIVKRLERSNIGGWAQERQGWQGHYPPHHGHIGGWAQERQGWQGHYPPHHGHIGGWAQERQGWQEPDDAEAMRMWNQFREWIAY
jgi:hypothetical protein